MAKILTGAPLPDRQSNRIAEKDPDLKMVNPTVAAIDIGAIMQMPAVHPNACDMPIRAFGTFTTTDTRL